MASYDDSTDCADAIALMNSCADFDGRANVKLLPRCSARFQKNKRSLCLGGDSRTPCCESPTLPLSHSQHNISHAFILLLWERRCESDSNISDLVHPYSQKDVTLLEQCSAREKLWSAF